MSIPAMYLILLSFLEGGQQLNESGSSQKDELSDILGPHFNIESMVRETGLFNKYFRISQRRVVKVAH